MYSKITISGKICTGKSSVFRELNKKLNWPTFSTGHFFREYVKEHNLTLNMADEQTDTLTHKVDGMVKEMLHQPGHLLLDSWLAGIMAEGVDDVLKVLLVADDTVRFQRFAAREQVSLEEAKTEVLLRDKSWFEKVKKIHNRTDFFNVRNYSVVINTTNMGVNIIVNAILKNLSH